MTSSLHHLHFCARGMHARDAALSSCLCLPHPKERRRRGGREKHLDMCALRPGEGEEGEEGKRPGGRGGEEETHTPHKTFTPHPHPWPVAEEEGERQPSPPHHLTLCGRPSSSYPLCVSLKEEATPPQHDMSIYLSWPKEGGRRRGEGTFDTFYLYHVVIGKGLQAWQNDLSLTMRKETPTGESCPEGRRGETLAGKKNRHISVWTC